MRSEDIVKLQEMVSKSRDNVETDITLFGNRYTVIQVITLLSYIRNAISENSRKKIEITIGGNVSDREFEFVVNSQKTDDLIAKDTLEIN